MHLDRGVTELERLPLEYPAADVAGDGRDEGGSTGSLRPGDERAGGTAVVSRGHSTIGRSLKSRRWLSGGHVHRGFVASQFRHEEADTARARIDLVVSKKPVSRSSSVFSYSLRIIRRIRARQGPHTRHCSLRSTRSAKTRFSPSARRTPSGLANKLYSCTLFARPGLPNKLKKSPEDHAWASASNRMTTKPARTWRNMGCHSTRCGRSLLPGPSGDL